LLSFLFDPEDGDDRFFPNVGYLSPDHTTLYPMRKKLLIPTSTLTLHPGNMISPYTLEEIRGDLGKI
jgi:hypothetical protein